MNVVHKCSWKSLNGQFTQITRTYSNILISNHGFSLRQQAMTIIFIVNKSGNQLVRILPVII